MFMDGIKDFKSRPLLYNKLIEQHKRQNPNCTCDVDYIEIK